LIAYIATPRPRRPAQACDLARNLIRLFLIEIENLDQRPVVGEF
jgi:hypothetical protein